MAMQDSRRRRKAPRPALQQLTSDNAEFDPLSVYTKEGDGILLDFRLRVVYMPMGSPRQPSEFGGDQSLLRPRQIHAGAMGHLPRCQKSSPATAKSHVRRPAARSMKRNRDDRLSALPDDILVNILDRLNVRDAARTSILSRRWSLLSAKLSRLIINAHDFLPEGVLNDKISGGDLVRVNSATVEVTKSMLTRRNPGEHTIRLLSTRFYLRDDVPISIGHAVGNAMVSYKIERAEFTVLTEKGRHQCTLADMANYGAQFVSFFDGCLDAFSILTRLYLENLRFAESDFFSNILVTCKQLKYLGFDNCWTDNPVTLHVEHAQLGELSFKDCRLGNVELKWLPRLTRVRFMIWWSYKDIPLSFGHVPLLEAVTLVNIGLSWHKMVKLSTLLFETSVQELHLGFKSEKIWVQPECLTKRLASAFWRLRIANLDCIPVGCDLTWTMFILEAAPSLEELYMSVTDHLCEMEMNKKKRRQQSYSKKKGVKWESATSNFTHHHLTKLTIFSFESFIVSHVRRVMKAAVNLKDVYLYDRLRCQDCYDLEPMNPTTFPLSKKHRCSMRKLMTEGIESRARICFLSWYKLHDDHAAMLL